MQKLAQDNSDENSAENSSHELISLSDIIKNEISRGAEKSSRQANRSHEI